MFNKIIFAFVAFCPEQKSGPFFIIFFYQMNNCVREAAPLIKGIMTTIVQRRGLQIGIILAPNFWLLLPPNNFELNSMTAFYAQNTKLTLTLTNALIFQIILAEGVWELLLRLWMSCLVLDVGSGSKTETPVIWCALCRCQVERRWICYIPFFFAFVHFWKLKFNPWCFIASYPVPQQVTASKGNLFTRLQTKTSA